MAEEAGGEIEGGGAAPAPAPAPGAPVGEASRWRQRALELEAELAAATKQIEALTAERAELAARAESLENQISAGERRREIDRLLADAGTIDDETAHLLVEVALAEMPTPEVGRAVEDVRRRKPWLFRPARSVAAGGSQSAWPSGTEGHDSVGAARRQAESGDRGALMRYLRARRTA